MPRKRKTKTLGGQPRTPSKVLVAARQATGAGAHGGNKRAQNRRARRAIRQALDNTDDRG